MRHKEQARVSAMAPSREVDGGGGGGVVVVRTNMVGPPYLYAGAQVCGIRTGRTCIFLLASFSAACCMIGLVFFTADLRMASGLWVAGLVLMAIGVVLLIWFVTLCCAARSAYMALPPAHPARILKTHAPRPSSAVHPVATSTPAYQLLPLNHNREHNAGQTDVLTDLPRRYLGGTIERSVGGPASTRASLSGSYLDGTLGRHAGTTDSLRGSYYGGTLGRNGGGPVASYTGNVGYAAQPEHYMGDNTGNYTNQPGSYIGDPAASYMGSIGSYVGQPRNYPGRQTPTFMTDQDNRYNGSLRNSTRISGSYEPRPAPVNYAPNETTSFPLNPKWDHQLDTTPRYADDDSTWSTLERTSRPDYLQHFPASRTGSYRPEEANVPLLLPPPGDVLGYSTGRMGTIDQRTRRQIDKPSPYCDVIPR